MSRNTTEYKSKICAKGVFRSARHENISKFYWKKGILVVLCAKDITVMHYSFGLGESSLDHRRREEFPAIFTMVVSFGGVYERT